MAATSLTPTRRAQAIDDEPGVKVQASSDACNVKRPGTKRRRSGTQEPQLALIHALPHEILVSIFQHMFQSPIAELYPPAILSVCRTWRRVALESPTLWVDPTVFVLDKDCIRNNPEWDLVIPARSPSRRGHLQDLAMLNILERCVELSHGTIKRVGWWTQHGCAVDDWLDAFENCGPNLEDISIFCDTDAFRLYTTEDSLPVRNFDSRRQRLHEIIEKSSSLRSVKLMMPVPTRGEVWPVPSESLGPLPRLETLTIMESDVFEEHRIDYFSEDERPTEQDSDGHKYWSVLARNVRVCNVGSFCDRVVLYAILENASIAAEVLVVDQSLFSEFTELCVRGGEYFANLRRLCLVSHPCFTREDLSSVLQRLTNLEELEGELELIFGCFHTGLLSVTIWVSGSSRYLKKYLGKLHGIKHLTIVGPDIVVKTVERALAPLGKKTKIGTDRQPGSANRYSPLVCPALCTLTFVLERTTRLAEKYLWPGLRSFDEVYEDYKKHREIQQCALRLMASRTRHELRHHERSTCDSEAEGVRVRSSLQRLTMRTYWCEQEYLWDLRVASSSKMTGLATPKTYVPEGAWAHHGHPTQSTIDIVPEAPEVFRFSDWKEAVTKSLQLGLCGERDRCEEILCSPCHGE